MSTAFDFCKKNEKIPFSEEKGEDVDKLNLHFFKNAEGLGEQRVPQWNPQSEFTSDEEKREFGVV